MSASILPGEELPTLYASDFVQRAAPFFNLWGVDKYGVAAFDAEQHVETLRGRVVSSRQYKFQTWDAFAAFAYLYEQRFGKRRGVIQMITAECHVHRNTARKYIQAGTYIPDAVGGRPVRVPDFNLSAYYGAAEIEASAARQARRVADGVLDDGDVTVRPGEGLAALLDVVWKGDNPNGAAAKLAKAAGRPGYIVVKTLTGNAYSLAHQFAEFMNETDGGEYEMIIRRPV
jgi:hypothetical protein